MSDVELALEAGADRVFINTALIKNPKIISDITKRYGSQCLSCSIEAKFISPNKWSVYYDCGREDSGLDVIEWIKQVQDLGVGEILLTSIDNEGTKNGFELPLYEAASKITHIPIVASGGAGHIQHIKDILDSGFVRAVALASILHYNISTLSEIKRELTH
jgi:imidazole glycerol-phosphate synthase subunit HisF